MSPLEWLALASAAAAVVAAAWQRINGAIAWTRGLVFVTRRVSSLSARVLTAYLDAHAGHRRSPADAGYDSVNTHVAPLGRFHRVWYQLLSASPRVFWVRRRPLWFSPGDKDAIDKHAGVAHRFSYIRGTVDFETMLLAAADWEAEAGRSVASGRFCVVRHHGARFDPSVFGDTRAVPPPGSQFARQSEPDWPSPASGNRLIGWTFDDVQPPPATALEMLSLRPELEDVVREIRDWFKLREWCAARGIPWRRGFLFIGPPGTGKSSLVRGVAEDLDIPIHLFDLASMSNADLVERWRRMSSTTPCVALIEDMDCVFNGRKNIAPVQGALGGGGLTFEALINCISGVERHDGVLFIITTNDLSAIDPALYARGDHEIPERPGRIDRLVTFEPLDETGRVKLALRILDGDASTAAELAQRSAGDSAAQFQERCYRIALARRMESRAA